MFYASWLVSTPAGDWLIVLRCKAWLPRIGSSFSSLQSLAWLTTDEHEACVAVHYIIHNTSILSAPDFWMHLPSYKQIGSPAFFQCTIFFSHSFLSQKWSAKVFGQVASWAGRQVRYSESMRYDVDALVSQNMMWHMLEWNTMKYQARECAIESAVWQEPMSIFCTPGWGTFPECQGASAFSLFVLCMISQPSQPNVSILIHFEQIHAGIS